MEDYFNRDISVPLYRQLADTIRQQIREGEITPGQKLKSESEMVAEYNVGRLTVRNALQLLVNEGILAKSQGKGTFCQSRESENAKALDIQVLLDMSDTYFIPYYVRGISEVLSRSDSNFLISDTKDNDQVLCSLLENLTKKNISGVIFQCTDACLHDSVSARIHSSLEALTDSGIPVIMIDGKYDDPGISSLYLHEESGGSRAAEHLSAFGHKRCAVISLDTHRDSRMRLKGFCEGAALFGMEIPTVIEAAGEWESALISAVKSGVTGVFAYNDDAAFRCVMALKKAGYDVPGDVSVIGFDDTYLTTACEPKLTSLAHPKEKMGNDAAELMLSMIRCASTQAVEKVYKTELVMRDSCGPVKNRI